MIEHQAIALGQRHAPHQWEYADAAARAAAVIADATQINKIALQLSDGTYWRLTTIAPMAWQQVMAPMANTFAALVATLGFTPEDASKKGAANGYAPLDAGQKVPAANLPSYVDDVLEYANLAALPGVGETGKIYTTLDTNKIYRWSGSAYIEISASPGTTDAVTEGVTNLYFTVARVLATVLTGLSVATNAAVTAADTVLVAIGKLQAQITGYAAQAITFTNKTLDKALLKSPKELTSLSATAATGTVNYDAASFGDLTYTVNATGNFTLNFRGDAGTTLSSLLNVNEELTVVFRNTNGASAFFANAFQIDGGAVTPKWAGGTAPTGGNVNSVDVYSFTIQKTAATPTYVVLATLTKFA